MSPTDRTSVSRRLRVIATCSQRKRRNPDPALLARNLPEEPVAVRVQDWLGRLRDSTGERLAAIDMYAGDHWSVVRDLETVGTAELEIDLWIVSAGYGLIPRDAIIQAYGATFSAAQHDFVLDRTQGEDRSSALGEWWRSLAGWSGPKPGMPRTLAALARAEPATPLLVIASAEYVAALAGDLAAARDALEEPERLSIASIGGRNGSELSGSLLPGDARVQDWLGGAMQSLNARLAREVVRRNEEWTLRRPEIAEHINRELESRGEFSRPPREPRDDAEVRSFIREALEQDPGARHTPLLRRFRDKGHACEQSRFRRLYQEVTGTPGNSQSEKVTP